MIPFSGYIIGGLLVTIAVGGGVGYIFYKDTQSTIATLRENNSKLEVAVDLKESKIISLEENFEKQKTLIVDLQKNNIQAEKRLDDTRKILRDHNLTNLSLKKPGLIENRINDGTKKAFDAFESDTAIE